ncbi:MAG: ArgE/DapE family deacylase [Acidimicrobiales bacterium]|nr:ArgE/DapE family deacylase [Acidimicrobiales bacterium]
MTTDWRARVLDEITERRREMVAALGDLVRTPSITGSDAEHEAQAAMAAALADDGLEVDHWALPLDDLRADPDFPGVEVPRDEAWGVVGRLPGAGDGRTLLLDGHIDVVPEGDRDAWTHADPFGGAVTATEVRGRGACDMKGGLLAARWAVRALAATGVPLRGDVLVASVEGEEDGGLGTFGLLRRGWTADCCVVPEPTGLGLVPACAGALTFRLRIRGRSAHAARRAEGVSVVDKLVPVLAALAALEAERNRDSDPLLDRWGLAYPLSLGVVRAGDWASTVPDLLVAEGRLGVALDEDVADARAALETAVAEAGAADAWLREHPVEVEWWGGQFASGRLPADSDLDRRVGVAHRTAVGTPMGSWGAPFGSDLRLLTGLGGIPTVHYGPGDVELAHAPDEAVPIAEVEATAAVLALLALDVCGPT